MRKVPVGKLTSNNGTYSGTQQGHDGISSRLRHLPVAQRLRNADLMATAQTRVWRADCILMETSSARIAIALLVDLTDVQIVGYAVGEQVTDKLFGSPSDGAPEARWWATHSCE